MSRARPTTQDPEQVRLRRGKWLRIGALVLLVLVAAGLMVAHYQSTRGFTLLASDGQPIHRAIVSGEMVDGRANSSWTYEGGYVRGRPDGPPLRQRVLAAWLEDGSPAPGATVVFEIPLESDSVAIRLPAEALISGTVVDTTGTPTEGLEVYVQLADMDGGYGRSPWFQDTSDEAGRFTLRGTSAAEAYELFVVPGGLANPVRVGTFPGGTKDVAVTLGTLGPIPITVVRTAGTPVEGVTVWVNRGTLARPQIHQSAYTGADGRAKIYGLLPDETYMLHVGGWRGRNRLGRPRLFVAPRRPWTPAPERIVLVETVVAVVDASGNPVPRATVWVSGAEIEGGPSEADEHGKFTVLAERGIAGKVLALPSAEVAHPPDGVEDHSELLRAHIRSLPRLAGVAAVTDLPTQKDGEIQVVLPARTKGK